MQPEIIKKTITLETKTEVVSENEIQVIPNTGVTYSMKLSLSKREFDIGFLDAVDDFIYGYGYGLYPYGDTSVFSEGYSEGIGFQNLL
jgi:hypothetical protein